MFSSPGEGGKFDGLLEPVVLPIVRRFIDDVLGFSGSGIGGGGGAGEEGSSFLGLGSGDSGGGGTYALYRVNYE